MDDGDDSDRLRREFPYPTLCDLLLVASWAWEVPEVGEKYLFRCGAFGIEYGSH